MLSLLSGVYPRGIGDLCDRCAEEAQQLLQTRGADIHADEMIAKPCVAAAAPARKCCCHTAAFSRPTHPHLAVLYWLHTTICQGSAALSVRVCTRVATRVPRVGRSRSRSGSHPPTPRPTSTSASPVSGSMPIVCHARARHMSCDSAPTVSGGARPPLQEVYTHHIFGAARLAH
jgi:hypothetical protein